MDNDSIDDLINDISKITISETIDDSDLIRVDYGNIREYRQKINNKLVFNAIKSKDLTKLHTLINMNEYKRVLADVELTESELVELCVANDTMNTILSGRISKKSSRQGKMDETSQLNVINSVSSKYGVNVDILNYNDFRPTKDGRIVSKKDVKDNKIKLCNCLKSFDGKISGKITGWVFAKIVFNTGGHQDNVLRKLIAYALGLKISKIHQMKNLLY